MTILVTGSAGHLGEAILRTLRSRGSPARVVDLKTSPFTDAVGSIVDPGFVGRQMDGVTAVIHTAPLHKPHVATHSKQGLCRHQRHRHAQSARDGRCGRRGEFCFHQHHQRVRLAAPAGGPAGGGVGHRGPAGDPEEHLRHHKTDGGESLRVVLSRARAAVVVLRTSRFFPEDDDDPVMRSAYSLDNAQANELLYRRLDIADAVSAHLLAVARAPEIGFGRYIVSATSPFEQRHLAALAWDAGSVVRELHPDCAQLYAVRGWRLFPGIDRVYVNERARRELGWHPEFDFAHVLRSLREGRDFRSSLAREVGSKGYHDTLFDDGPYPVAT